MRELVIALAGTLPSLPVVTLTFLTYHFDSGGSKQKWVPLSLEPAKLPSSKGGGGAGGGLHRDRHRDGGVEHSHGRHERERERERDKGRWRSDRDRYHPPPRYSNHPPSEYSESYNAPPPEGGYGYHSGRGGGRGGGRGRNWRYPPPGGQGPYKCKSLHSLLKWKIPSKLGTHLVTPLYKSVWGGGGGEDTSVVSGYTLLP